MYKNKLESMISESFINDQIDVDRFLSLYEKIEKIDDKEAKRILEQMAPVTNKYQVAKLFMSKIRKQYSDCMRNCVRHGSSLTRGTGIGNPQCKAACEDAYLKAKAKAKRK